MSQAQRPKKLFAQMREALQTRHYSIRTEHAYVDWARRFILFHQKRHPKEMGSAEIAAFLTYLALDRQVAASHTEAGSQRPAVSLSEHTPPGGRRG
jgi:integrase-like protein